MTTPGTQMSEERRGKRRSNWAGRIAEAVNRKSDRCEWNRSVRHRGDADRDGGWRGDGGSGSVLHLAGTSHAFGRGDAFDWLESHGIFHRRNDHRRAESVLRRHGRRCPWHGKRPFVCGEGEYPIGDKYQLGPVNGAELLAGHSGIQRLSRHESECVVPDRCKRGNGHYVHRRGRDRAVAGTSRSELRPREFLLALGTLARGCGHKRHQHDDL